MPFALMSDEELVRESRYSTRFLFWGHTGHFRITSRRLALTHSQWGSETEENIPLENIDAHQIGTSNSPRLLIVAIILGFLGFAATVTLVGAIVGVPMLVAAAIVLLFYFLGRRRTLVIKSGNHEMQLDMKGMTGFSDVEQLFTEVEEARIARLKDLYT